MRPGLSVSFGLGPVGESLTETTGPGSKNQALLMSDSMK
jgi:hypothetical protein